MVYFQLTGVCSDEAFGHEVNKYDSDLPSKGDELLTIDGNPVDEGEFMFEQGIYLSVFYCLCFVNERQVHMLQDRSKEERYPDLDLEEVF